MFYTLCIIATFCYALQNTLLASFYRSIDQLSAVAYRGLTIGITMAPLLLFVDWQRARAISSLLPELSAAVILAVLGNWCIAHAMRALRVGVALGLSMSGLALAGTVFGALFLGDYLSSQEVLISLLLLSSVCALGFMHDADNVNAAQHVRTGMIYCAGFSLLTGGANILVGGLSRQSDPILVGYLWEVAIGCVAWIITAIRNFYGGVALQRLSLVRLSKLALCAAPTGLATAAYAAALTMGPVGIALSITSTMMVISVVLAFFFYAEKLNSKQVLLVLLSCALVAWLALQRT